MLRLLRLWSSQHLVSPVVDSELHTIPIDIPLRSSQHLVSLVVDGCKHERRREWRSQQTHTHDPRASDRPERARRCRQRAPQACRSMPTERCVARSGSVMPLAAGLQVYRVALPQVEQQSIVEGHLNIIKLKHLKS